MALSSNSRIEFSAFHKSFFKNLYGRRRAIAAFTRLQEWGLADIPLVQLIFEYTVANPVGWDQWYASAQGVAPTILKTAKRLKSFHQLPGAKGFIASLQNGPPGPDPFGSDFGHAVEKLPQVLSLYGSLLEGLSTAPNRQTGRRLVESRFLYLLFLAAKAGKPKASDYEVQCSIAELISAGLSVRRAGATIDYKTVANRIARFKQLHSKEAEHASAVVNKFGPAGIPMLVRWTYQLGFLAVPLSVKAARDLKHANVFLDVLTTPTSAMPSAKK